MILYVLYIPTVLTIVSEAGGCDDGHGDHDEAAAAPHILHEELLDHDIPETLGEDQVHLVGQSPVALLQLTHLHLQQTFYYSIQQEIMGNGVGYDYLMNLSLNLYWLKSLSSQADLFLIWPHCYYINFFTVWD